MSEALATVLDSTPDEERNLYQQYDVEEESERIAYHYEVDPEFYVLVTGGEWNTYSCSIFGDNVESLTQAQEKKLDEFARLMDLKPGKHILDVGCGWGGPLTYLCKKYGVTGLGITVSEKSAEYARQRAARHGVQAEFEVCHWANLERYGQFDAIYSDEVLVHIADLDGFYAKCNRLLKETGIMCHKELHLTHNVHKNWDDRLGQHVNKVFGFTGNYRMLHEEISPLDTNNFRMKEVLSIPIEDYHQTVSQHWLPNMLKHKKQLIEMTSEEHFRDIRLYLKSTLRSFNSKVFHQHIVASEKVNL